MVTNSQLQSLIGQRVVIDQDHTEPPVVIGLLEDDDCGGYFVEDEHGRGTAMFTWAHVESLNGRSIGLADPAWENEVPPDYPIDNSEFEEQAEWGYLDLPRRGEEDEEW